VDRLLSVQDLAATLQVPVATIYRWRYTEDGPPRIRVGRHLRFRESDVEAWLRRREDKSVRSATPPLPASKSAG
jgi:excisionase family DNA binding protein